MRNEKENIGAIEAVLFVAGEPVSIRMLCDALGITDLEMEMLLAEMEETYRRDARGFFLQRVGDALQFVKNVAYASFIQETLFPTPKQTLSRSVLETLSIIAYRQPVTRMEIEAIRGVKCDYALSVLRARRLVDEVGRKDVIGRPVLFGTTDEFLRHFGISSVADLPAEDAFAQQERENDENGGARDPNDGQSGEPDGIDPAGA